MVRLDSLDLKLLMAVAIPDSLSPPLKTFISGDLAA